MKPELVEPGLWQRIQGLIDADFGEGATKKIMGDLVPVVIPTKRAQSLYLVPGKWVATLLEGFEDFDVAYLGLWLGDFADDRFRPSLPILEKMSELTDRILVVHQKAAEAFTYGRSILREGVAGLSQSLKRGQRVIVKDKQGHVIGLAALSVDGQIYTKLAKEKLVAKNLVDIGWYVRRMG